MNMKNHVLWMIGGFVAILVAAQFFGPAAYSLFFLFCMAMMVMMMFGMDHGSHGSDTNGTKHEHK